MTSSNRNLLILGTSQFIAVTGSVLMVTLGGIVGATLSSHPAHATLPPTLMVVGTALGTIPAAALMRSLGRAVGFALAKLLAAFACGLAIFGLSQSSFLLWVSAAGLFGLTLAFVQQYRFAAAESVTSDRTSRAISWVLLGSIGGAFLGPLLAVAGKDWLAWGPYTGSLATVGGLCLLSCGLLSQLKEPEVTTQVTSAANVPAPARRRTYWVAVLGGITAYGVMTLVMTATPLAMHLDHSHGMQDVAWVIQSHVMAMYLPSLFSGWLVDRFGARRLMMVGTLLLAVALTAGLQGQAVVHFWWALVLLGLGWNFLYVGSTALLTVSYHPEERFRAQALNDFCVFGSAAAASWLAGVTLHFLGWTSLILLALPLVLLLPLALYVTRRPKNAGTKGASGI